MCTRRFQSIKKKNQCHHSVGIILCCYENSTLSGTVTVVDDASTPTTVGSQSFMCLQGRWEGKGISKFRQDSVKHSDSVTFFV